MRKTKERRSGHSITRCRTLGSNSWSFNRSNWTNWTRKNHSSLNPRPSRYTYTNTSTATARSCVHENRSTATSLRNNKPQEKKIDNRGKNSCTGACVGRNERDAVQLHFVNDEILGSAHRQSALPRETYSLPRHGDLLLSNHTTVSQPISLCRKVHRKPLGRNLSPAANHQRLNCAFLQLLESSSPVQEFLKTSSLQKTFTKASWHNKKQSVFLEPPRAQWRYHLCLV